MVYIGDVLAVIATLLGVGVTSWALMVSCALLFPVKVHRARVSSEMNVRTNMATGILMLIPMFAGVAMLGNPVALIKVLGWVILLAILSLGAIGATGLGYLASDTIRRMSPQTEEYPAFLRGSAFLVTASMLPILGWFVFAPCILLAAFGGGLRAITGKSVTPAPAVIDQLAG